MEQKTVKVEIGKVFAVVIVVVAIATAASLFLSSNYYKGLIGLRTITDDTKLISEPITTDSTLEKIDLSIDTDKTLTTSELEIQPLNIASTVKEELEALTTPPNITFTYLDKIDPISQSIYGQQSRDTDSVVLVFKLKNTGDLSAYLRGFDTYSTYGSNEGCHDDTCRLHLSQGGTLVKFEYNYLGNVMGQNIIGSDSNQITSEYGVNSIGNGSFEYPGELTNVSALEIPGNSEVIFGIIQDTTNYGTVAGIYFTEGRAYIVPGTLSVVDASQNPVTATVPNITSPDTIYYYYT